MATSLMIAPVISPAVDIVLSKLTDAIREKIFEGYGVRDKVQVMERELQHIKGLLEAADSKSNHDERVRNWVREVRDISYRIQDFIDTFLVEKEEIKKYDIQPKLTRAQERLQITLKINKNVHWFLSEIEEISASLEEIRVAFVNFDLGQIDAGSEEQSGLTIDVPKVVGFDSVRHEIERDLLDTSISRGTVLSIVGMGGIGKTTLARMIYESVQNQFDCGTWLSVPPNFNQASLNDLLRQFLYSIEPQIKDEELSVPDATLPLEIGLSLSEKKYLIILDDVWTSNVWDAFERILPNSNNGSRVLVTSRSLDVVNRSAEWGTSIHKLTYLTEEDSQSLLLRKALPHTQPDNYPPDLVRVAKQLTKKCGGLPMALTTLGGILSRKEPTYSEWKVLEQTMNWQNDGQECMQVLAKSYNDLRDELKSCFLYLALFPEEIKISVKHVTRMWIAEGFITQDADGTLEDKACNYLEELVQRCLVEDTERSWDGYCKYCSMHDLLRGLAIHEANRRNFFTVFSKARDSTSLLDARVTRAALQFFTPREYDRLLTNTGSLLFSGQCLPSYSEFKRQIVLNIGCPDMREGVVCLANLYSIMLFRPCLLPLEGLRRLNTERPDMSETDVLTNTRSLLFFGQCLASYSRFKLLRVLNIEHVDMSGRDVNYKNWLRDLTHLRYLGFRYCGELPRGFGLISFNSIKNLETLEFKRTQILDEPNDSLWKIPTLRHVISDSYVPVICGLSNWNKLKNLHTLNSVSLKTFPKLGCNINLRKLGLRLDSDFWEKNKSVGEARLKLNSLLKQMNLLVSLGVGSSEYVPFPPGHGDDLPCYETIQHLSLEGRWPIGIFPKVEMFPKNLTKLTLIGSRLDKDPMPVLERLQSLRVLRLWGDSYVGTELICSEEGFPRLEILDLLGLHNLCHWDIKDGAMPVLRQLKIAWCSRLHELPELQKVLSLQHLTVRTLSKNLEERMMQMEDQYKINHISPPAKTSQVHISSQVDNTPIQLNPNSTDNIQASAAVDKGKGVIMENETLRGGFEEEMEGPSNISGAQD